ncbi:MAG: D-glycerate dehydrogenase [Chloroflexi bacterium]|nr:D-glycerate dehydrogenase [Chloroflexota bacterium]
MPTPSIYVTRRIFPEAIALLRSVAEVRQWESDLPPPYERLLAEAKQSDALFTLLTDRIDAPLLAAAPQLRVVSNMAVGYNNVDVAAATARGIYIGNTPGVLTETTAEFAFALLLAWARRVPEAQRFAREGRWKTWEPMSLLGVDLHGATLGIVGVGRIGEAMARRARAFQMRILYQSRTRKPALERELGIIYAGLDTLLAESDFVSLHVPLNAETRGLIGARQLAKMKPTAALINTARGDVVDQAALIKALQAKSIAGAALDVTDPEPLPAGNPLYQMENVLLTPHIASASRGTRLRMAMMAALNIVDVLEGRAPTHCVNSEATGRRPSRAPA